MKGRGALGVVAAVLGLAWAASAATPQETPAPAPPKPPTPPKPKSFTWAPVRMGDTIVPGLGAQWEENPKYPGKVPDFFDVDTHTWVIDGHIFVPDPDALVVNREEI